MTKGVGFLFIMLIEGAVAAMLGAWLYQRLDLSRLGAGLRTSAAAIIGTGATHPLQWMAFPPLSAAIGVSWQAIMMIEGGAVLVEALFYAAVLRGHWGWSLALSVGVNAISFGAVLAIAGSIATGL
jgi:hypothetical protein